jgi:hypothetical protein
LLPEESTLPSAQEKVIEEISRLLEKMGHSATVARKQRLPQISEQEEKDEQLPVVADPGRGEQLPAAVTDSGREGQLPAVVADSGRRQLPRHAGGQLPTMPFTITRSGRTS